jgi:hypothetical protein
MTRFKLSTNAKRFEYLGTRVAVETRDQALSAWLIEFLSPYFSNSSSQRTNLEIEVVTSVNRFEELQHAVLARASQDVVCFLRDSHNLNLPCWRLDDGSRIVYDENFRVFTVFDTHRRRIEIVGTSPTRQLRVSVMRAVREITLIELLRKRIPILHAGALSFQTDGLAIVGPKFAGKTTLLIAGLISTRSAFVANDRLIVDITQNGVMARGFPTIISIRNGEPDFFPELKKELGRRDFDHASTLAELRSFTRDKQASPPERFSLSPAQLCDVLGVSLLPETRLRALVFPLIDSRKRRSRLDQLDAKSAVNLMDNGLFRAGIDHVERTIFSDFLEHEQLIEPDYRQTCDSLVKLLPAYRLTLAQDILQQPHLSAELVANMISSLNSKRKKNHW